MYIHKLVLHPPVRVFRQQKLSFMQVQQLVNPGRKQRYGHMLVQHVGCVDGKWAQEVDQIYSKTIPVVCAAVLRKDRMDI